MIPIIDFKSSDVEKKMQEAYTTCGFAVFTNVYDSWFSEFSDWKQIMEEFFHLSEDIKKQYSYSSVADNLGYNSVEKERLSPNKPGDLKEAFNWKSPHSMKNHYCSQTIQIYR